jgi:hypothetical protein
MILLRPKFVVLAADERCRGDPRIARKIAYGHTPHAALDRHPHR